MHVTKDSALDVLTSYLRTLRVQSEEPHADFPSLAWTTFVKDRYDAPRHPDRSVVDGIGRPLPYVSIGVPASDEYRDEYRDEVLELMARAVDLANASYVYKRSVFALWLVPSNQQLEYGGTAEPGLRFARIYE